ncbi:hypothetical protein ACFYRC_36910 [Streptomyces sp. NPDC005279]|uniref:hypothetical protein n=1 Tax=Streptomyces sp. NPDC005279 TaxID=3364712 RepID=UPI003699AB73
MSCSVAGSSEQSNAWLTCWTRVQTTQNLAQITVLGLSSALFKACLAAGSTDTVGYGAAFGLLLAPCTLAALLAPRARSA